MHTLSRLSHFENKATHLQNDAINVTESSNQSVESTHTHESKINVADVQAVNHITGPYEAVKGRDDFCEENTETKTECEVCEMERTQTRGIFSCEKSRDGDSVPSSVPVLQLGSREKTLCMDATTSEGGGHYHRNSDVAGEISETGVQDNCMDDCSNLADYTSEGSVQSKRSGSQTSKRPERKKRRVNRPPNQDDCLPESSLESKRSGSQISKQPKRKKKCGSRPEMTEQELRIHKLKIWISMIDGKPYECEKCGKGYKTRQGLSVHLSVGICVRQKCKYCGLEFLYKDWQKHLINVHAEEIEVSPCDYCDTFFTKRSDKSSHILMQHKGKV
ncbi:zinc finger protein 652-like [Ptychodera flava]|uniref:zinc finger protein 652-like n=1 Tax=Ptychodera flava TaxID=63121 RepID=UPI00396AAB86